jgi:UDP-glucuronate decarboxylase
LISGACGFLGSWFIAVIHYLNQNTFKTPCTVYAVDSGIASDKNNALMQIEDPNILYRQDDISTMKVTGKVDYIIHAAGIASPVYYRKYPVETIDGMVLGLSNLLKFAVKNPVKSFLYFSSSEMYGNPHPEFVPTPETYNGNVSATGPRSCYDESKRMGEAMCVAYQRIHNIPVKWVRPFNVSGPGMRVNDDRVVPKFVFAGLKGETVTIHMPGLQTRTFCYVTDAMVGFFKALLIGKNGEVYNIGRDKEEVTMVQLAQSVKQAFDNKLKLEKIECPYRISLRIKLSGVARISQKLRLNCSFIPG